MDEVNAALTVVFREEVGRLTAALVRILDDFAVAEDIVQDALLVALEHWPREGIPARPGAWLLTVARRRALNQLSRDASYRTKLTQLEQPVPREPDDRVRLMFMCCHPALSRPAQIALTLRAVCGFTTAQIAHAFLMKEATVAQRIVRGPRGNGHKEHSKNSRDTPHDRLSRMAELYRAARRAQSPKPE